MPYGFIVALALDLILQLAVSEAGVHDFLDLPFFITFHDHWRRGRDDLPGERVLGGGFDI